MSRDNNNDDFWDRDNPQKYKFGISLFPDEEPPHRLNEVDKARMRRTNAKLDKLRRRIFGTRPEVTSEKDADIHEPFHKCEHCYFTYITNRTYQEHLKRDHKTIWLQGKHDVLDVKPDNQLRSLPIVMKKKSEVRIEKMTIEQDAQNNKDPLEEADEWAKPSSKFVRLQTGLPMVLDFDKNKIKKEPFDYKKGSGPQETILCKVKTPNEDDPSTDKDFRISSKRLWRSIRAQLDRGHTRLEITKHGSAESTYYDVFQADEPPLSQQQK